MSEKKPIQILTHGDLTVKAFTANFKIDEEHTTRLNFFNNMGQHLFEIYEDATFIRQSSDGFSAIQFVKSWEDHNAYYAYYGGVYLLQMFDDECLVTRFYMEDVTEALLLAEVSQSL